MRTGWLAGMIALCFMFLLTAFGAVTPYPAYPGAAESLAYKVTVDGQPVFVHRLPTYNQFQWMDHASFSMTGKVHVTITSLVNERSIVTCYIRPLAYAIHPQISGKTIGFDLDQPRYLVIFFNEEPTFQSPGLLLFAEPEEKDAPKLGDANVVNVLDYKTDNTGKTLDTEKINHAIADVSARPGGGVLFFPAGVYLTGTIMMQSNVKLYVDKGALIRGSRRSADYGSPPMPAGQRPLRALVVFNNVESAGLMGRGAIDMEGYPWLWHDVQPDTGDGKARSDEGLVNDPHGTGVKGYIVNHCRNISFQGLLLLRSAYWTTTVSDTENFSATNIKIVNRKQQYHDDAFDFTGNSNHHPGTGQLRHDHGRYVCVLRREELYRRRRGGEGVRELHLHFGTGDRVWWRAEHPELALRGRAFRDQPEQVRRMDPTDPRILYRQRLYIRAEIERGHYSGRLQICQHDLRE